MVNPDRSRVRIEAAGDHPDDAMSTLAPLYGGSQWWSAATGRPYRYRYAAVGDDALTLRTSRIEGRIHGVIPVGGEIVVQWIARGTAVVDAGRDDIVMRPGRPQLFPAHRPFVFDFADYDQRIVHLDRALVERLAFEQHGIRAGALRFDHRRAPSAAAVGLWFDAVGLASRALERGQVGDLLWHEITRMTITGFLELYPPSAAEAEPVPLERGEARIRRVIEHIHAHAALPLTPTDLARAADVSVRTLQQSCAPPQGEKPKG
ncbi:MAG: hypothetical protein ACTHJL_11905 [Amnibacterium sp.]